MEINTQQVSDFEISMEESNWKFNEENILESVLCFADGKEFWIDVQWDEDGAYVMNDTEKEYVLVNVD